MSTSHPKLCAAEFVLGAVAICIAGCRGSRPVAVAEEPSRAAIPAGTPGRILSLPATEALASERLRTRIQLVDGEPAVLECVEFLRSDAPVGEKVQVVDFLAGEAHPSLMDWLVEALGAPEVPRPLALACHRALDAAAFLRVELDPELHFEERRRLVARDWAVWWHAHRKRSQSEWLVGRLPAAHELERLELIRQLMRVGDVAAVPTLMKYVDAGTLEFRAATLLTLSYLTNTVFLEPASGAGGSDPRPPEVRLLDAIVRCQEWWAGAADRSSEQWVRDGFAARGAALHDPPMIEDLLTLARALEDPHPAPRAQALRHLIRWTGETILEDPALGAEAFHRMGEAWRGWILSHRDALAWDPESGRFAPASR